MMIRKLSVAAILGLVASILALPALATSGNCETYTNHSGHIPGSYDYAEFYEDGQLVTTVETNGEDVFVNPAGWDAGESWDQVKKCEYTTTTTLPEETTTTIPEETTTTQLATTTTTIVSTTSSTVPEPSSTTSTVPATSTSAPSTTVPAESTTTQPDEPVLPFTGISRAQMIGLLIAGVAALGIGSVLVREFRSE